MGGVGELKGGTVEDCEDEWPQLPLCMRHDNLPTQTVDRTPFETCLNINTIRVEPIKQSQCIMLF